MPSISQPVRQIASTAKTIKKAAKQIPQNISKSKIPAKSVSKQYGKHKRSN